MYLPWRWQTTSWTPRSPMGTMRADPAAYSYDDLAAAFEGDDYWR